jgi:hypothetical protein
MIFVIPLIVLGIFNSYFLVRNYYVLKFRLYIIGLCYKKGVESISAGYDVKNGFWALDIVSGDRMLFSFKRLKLENYYTKEQVWKLTHSFFDIDINMKKIPVVSKRRKMFNFSEN